MSSSAIAAPVSGTADSRPTFARLAVTWQHPQVRGHEAVGLLTCDDDGFHFRYLRRAATVKDFQPFLGFDDLRASYSSPTLFPLFTQRIIRTSRPDYLRYLRALWLTPQAGDWLLLARSQGQREGDGIRVFMEPSVAANGVTETMFLVHGVRHRLNEDRNVEAALQSLRRGSPLRLRDEPSNPVDPLAVLVVNYAGTSLGWVPSILLSYVHHVRKFGTPHVEVLQCSGPDIPPGYRLLVLFRGQVQPGYRPFDGPEWKTFVD